MKKLMLMAFLFVVPATAISQDSSVFDFDEVTYFGVDFSKVMIMGAGESDSQFLTAFEGINNLVLVEQSKYDLGRSFDKQVILGDLATVYKRNNESRKMRTLDPGHTMSLDEMHEIVDAYRCEGDMGYGLIIAGDLLNKLFKQGNYVILFFDRSNGDIVYYQRAKGKAGGFGLRNFWAGSLYDVLKKWKY